MDIYRVIDIDRGIVSLRPAASPEAAARGRDPIARGQSRMERMLVYSEHGDVCHGLHVVVVHPSPPRCSGGGHAWAVSSILDGVIVWDCIHCGARRRDWVEEGRVMHDYGVSVTVYRVHVEGEPHARIVEAPDPQRAADAALKQHAQGTSATVMDEDWGHPVVLQRRGGVVSL